MSRAAERAARAARMAEINARIWTLTQDQADVLREAMDTAGGLYVPCTARSDVMRRLVEGGCATLREEPREGGTRSVHDSRPCRWTDYYLVPTEAGLALLAHYDRP